MILCPARASDLDEVCALLATATRPPEYFHALFTADPAFDPAQIRVARMGGRIVACAKMYPRALRLGTMVVPACGIGNLRTDQQRQHKGLAGALLSACLTAMYLEGALLAPLFAPRRALFARHGWHVIPEIQLEIPAGVLAAPSMADKPGDARVRLCEEHDLDAVMALYESVNAARAGTLVRERDDWLRCLTVLALHGATICVATHGDEIVGYMAVQPWNTSIDVLEMLLAPQLIAPVEPGQSSAATDVVLSLLRAALAQNRDAAVVRAGLPADYRRLVCDALAPHVATAECADLMLRMVDPMRLLQQLAPVLSARLRAGHDVVPPSVRIGPVHGGAVLRAGHDGVVVERPHRDDEPTLPEAVFLALLLGTEDAWVQLDNLPLSRAIGQTLQHLFPRQDWVFWRSDAF
jgi:predicted N-acetyltransferase YhbS